MVNVKRELEHSRLEYIIYRVFSRANNSHPYAYASSDIRIQDNGERDGAWDILLLDNVALDDNRFKPIFIEVKSIVSSAADVMENIKKQMDHTVKMLGGPKGLNYIIGQIPEEVGPQNLTLDEPEFVLFLPSNSYHQVYKRIMLESPTPDPNGRPIILWSLDNLDTSTRCISIPYADDKGVSKCKNIIKNGKPFIICKHDNDELTNWIKASGSQKLGTLGGIMPSGKGFTDIAVNIMAILTTGRVFNNSVDKLSRADITSKIGIFFTTYRIFIADDSINSLIDIMKACQILMPNDDILHTYSLNRGVSKRTKREDKLLEDVVKRLVKYNFGSPSETLQGVGG